MQRSGENMAYIASHNVTVHERLWKRFPEKINSRMVISNTGNFSQYWIASANKVISNRNLIFQIIQDLEK